MFIENCTVSEYKRLFLAFINKINYTPTTRINIIVGKNGSGKTGAFSIGSVLNQGSALFRLLKKHSPSSSSR